jgi:hypothetical protein
LYWLIKPSVIAQFVTRSLWLTVFSTQQHGWAMPPLMDTAIPGSRFDSPARILAISQIKVKDARRGERPNWPYLTVIMDADCCGWRQLREITNNTKEKSKKI